MLIWCIFALRFNFPYPQQWEISVKFSRRRLLKFDYSLEIKTLPIAFVRNCGVRAVTICSPFRIHFDSFRSDISHTYVPNAWEDYKNINYDGSTEFSNLKSARTCYKGIFFNFISILLQSLRNAKIHVSHNIMALAIGCLLDFEECKAIHVLNLNLYLS
jgi:hypothetical protein